MDSIWPKNDFVRSNIPSEMIRSACLGPIRIFKIFENRKKNFFCSDQVNFSKQGVLLSTLMYWSQNGENGPAAGRGDRETENSEIFGTKPKIFLLPRSTPFVIKMILSEVTYPRK